MLADREHLQAQLVSQHGVAEDLGHPVRRPVHPSGALITLQVTQRQDAQFRYDLRAPSQPGRLAKIIRIENIRAQNIPRTLGRLRACPRSRPHGLAYPASQPT